VLVLSLLLEVKRVFLLALEFRLALRILLLKVKVAGLTAHPFDLRSNAHHWVKLRRLLRSASARQSHERCEPEADYKRNAGVSQIAPFN
jgi:hypothetical protein